ncbi:propionate CoA-transferase [Streptomyces sp. SLBN-118]|uniref:acyl CoA:acetate/3-ketoacid CoA transferase n=1 Tax=Streptomyces sp. SLBN-118 TaxID=2768454 RepID=UPI00114D66EA|nr:CoA-transferase [Streptomyces sp. SLBN-118]TQK51258.1 propionate CoA-transferase [Streptomyces sp. SLBN-118]
MTRTKVISAAEAADLVPEGATVSISSSSGLGCPDAVLRAIGVRFASTGAPSGLTTVHPIAAGDMYGIKGIDHLAQPGLLHRIFAGSYPSGPSSADPPLVRKLIEASEIQAYNLPSGVLFQMHRSAATGQPGVLTTVGLDTFIDPRREGGRMNGVTPEFVRVEHFDGREWLYFPTVPVDVAVIRGTTADEHGNITMEDEGAPLGALDQALAARSNGGIVIAQVKRVAEGRSLPAQQVRVPGILVDRVVVDPDQLQTTQIAYDPALAGTLRRPLAEVEPAQFGLEKIIARRAAMELSRGAVVNLGFGISALVPRVLLEEGCHEEVTWVIEQGPIGGFPLTGFAFGCALNPQAILPSSDQFTLLQSGGFDTAMLSFLEIDTEGNINVSALPGRSHVTAGVGGFADITANARHLVFSGYFTAGRREIDVDAGELRLISDGNVPKLVEKVRQVTFSGRRAVANGQRVTVVTERCVMQLCPEGLTVTEVAPGIDLERDVLDRAAYPLQVSSQLTVMDPRLFRPEPLRLQLPDAGELR